MNNNGEKEPKNMEQILIKRGYNVPNLRFRCPKKAKYFKLLEYLPIIKQKCYLAHIFSNYKDFFQEKSQLKELITKWGHKYIFLLKFYYEINLIEIY